VFHKAMIDYRVAAESICAH